MLQSTRLQRPLEIAQNVWLSSELEVFCSAFLASKIVDFTQSWGACTKDYVEAVYIRLS